MDCFQKLGQVERFLATVSAAEAELATVKRTLAEVCDLPTAAPAADAPAVAVTAAEAAGPLAQSEWPPSEQQALKVSLPLDLAAVTENGAEWEKTPHTNMETPANRRSQSAVWSDEMGYVGVDGIFQVQTIRSTREEDAVSAGYWTLHPDGNVRAVWDVLGLFFIMSETYAIPFFIAFRVDFSGNLFLWCSIVNVFFLTDICMSFITGYRIAEGRYEMRVSRIAPKYIRGTLAIDCLASIPWEWVGDWVPVSGSMAQCTKLLRLFRIARLVRMFKKDMLPESVKGVIDFNPILVFFTRVAMLLFILCSITHWFACIWYIVGTAGDDDDETWLSKMKLVDSNTSEQYAYALYFTLTTMTTVGYGDVTPQNPTEVVFATFLLLIATVVFAALMGSLTDVITSLSTEKNIVREKVSMLSRYMSWRAMPVQLYINVRSHLLHLWETNRDYDAYEEDIKDKLPPLLRQELCFHIYGNLLRSNLVFAWARDYEAVLMELAINCQQTVFGRGDRLFRVGEASESLLFLTVGSVRITRNERLSSTETWEEDGQSEAPDGSPRTGSTSTPRVQPMPGSDWPSAPNLKVAAGALRIQDLRIKWAARLIQRRWKGKRLIMGGPLKPSKPSNETRTVKAPSYFGETCIWEPVSQWDRRTVKHTYTALCIVRCEVVRVQRASVKEIIERFSPWLGERFDLFRQTVVRSTMEEAGIVAYPTHAGSGSRPESPRMEPATATSVLPALPAPAAPSVPADRAPQPLAEAAGGQPGVAAQAAVAVQGNIQARWSELANRSRAEAARLQSRSPQADSPINGPKWGANAADYVDRGSTQRNWSSLRSPLLRSTMDSGATSERLRRP